jgi:GDPmannose 4,6-dehydratase
MTKSALITGITGQDGSYLAELLLSKGYKVYGLVRRSSTINVERISHIEKDITLLPGDLLDQNSLSNAIRRSQPDEVYNLGAQSFVATSWDQPELTGQFTALGVTRLLEAIKTENPKIRFYQASSSEMFGSTPPPQSEKTPFHPRSPYGVSKLYGHFATINYRESYDMFACAGILFNHESPRRGLEFVTRKVSNAVAQIKLGLRDKMTIGNLDAKRDWGFAGDYVRAMWMMLQQDQPEDYVIATGISKSVRELVDVAFKAAGLNYHDYVSVDPSLLRPAEVDFLCGDSSNARKKLGWKPDIAFEQLVNMMVEEDLNRNRRHIVASKADIR